MDEKEKERLQQLYNKIRSSGELDNPAVRPIIQKAIEKGLLVDNNFGKPRPNPAPVPGDPTLGRMAPGNTLAKKPAYPSPLKPPVLDVAADFPAAAPLQRSDIAKNKSPLGFLANAATDIVPTVGNMVKGVVSIAGGVPMGLTMGAMNAKNAADLAAEARRAVERGDFKEAERLVKMAEDAQAESDAQRDFLFDMSKGFLGGDTGMVAKMKTRDMFEQAANDPDLPADVRARYKSEVARLNREIPQGVGDAFYENPIQSTLNAIGIVSPFLRAGVGAEIGFKAGRARYNAAASRIAKRLGNEEGSARMAENAAKLNDAAIQAKKSLLGVSTIDDTIQSLGIPGVVRALDKVASKSKGYNAAKAGVARAATLPINIPGRSNLGRKLGGKVFSAQVANEFMDLADPAYRSQQFNKAITDVLADRAQQAAYSVKYKQQPDAPPPVDAPGIPPASTPPQAGPTPPPADTPLPESRLIGGQVDLPGIELPTDRPQADLTLEQLDEAGNPVPVRTSQQSEAGKVGAEPLDVAALRRAEEAPQVRVEPTSETLTAPDPTIAEAPAPETRQETYERLGMTAPEVSNSFYQDLKATEGQRFADKYFRQVDRLIDPVENSVLEYRRNGVVVREGDRAIFHPLTDMELSQWGIERKPRPEGHPYDLTAEFPKTSTALVEAPLAPGPVGAALAAIPAPPPVDLTTPLTEAITPPKMEPVVPNPEAASKPESRKPIATAVDAQGRRITALPDGLDEPTAQMLAARILHENADNKALIPSAIEALGLDRQGRAAIAERVQDIVAAASEERMAQGRRPNPTPKDLRAWVEKNRTEAIQQVDTPTSQPDGMVEQAAPEAQAKPSLTDRFGTGAAAASIIPLNLDSPILQVAGIAGAAVLYAVAKHAPALAKKLHDKLNTRIESMSAPARRWDTLMSQYIEARLPAELATGGAERTPEEIGRIRQEIFDTVEREFEHKDKKAALSVGAEFMQIGDSIVQVMDTLGQELVNAGLIDKKAYDENSGFYLRRIYEYWENPEGYLEKAEAELRAAGMDDNRIQAMLGAKERYFQDIKGRPIGDAEKVGTAPSGRRAKKAFTEREELTAEQLDMLREIAPASIRVRRGGEITGRELSKAELVNAVREKFAIAPARANEIREAAAAGVDPATLNLDGPMEEAMYYYPDQFARVEANDGLIGLGRWVPVEGSAPEWVGMEIPLTVHKSLTEAEWRPTTIAQKLLYIWKGGVTAWNPSAYLGNIFGNTLLSYLGGGLRAFNPITLAKAAESIRARDEAFQIAMEHSDHPFESMRLEISTRKHLDPAIQYPSNVRDWLRKEGGAFKDWTTDMYGGIDTLFKHALFIDTMDRLEMIDPRMTKDQRASQAGRLVAQSFPNFRHGTPIKALRPAVKAARRGAAPFIAWDASAIPIVAHAFMQHPHRVAMFPLLYKGYQDAIDKLAQKRVDRELWQEEQRILPDYLKRNAIRIPESARLDDQGFLASARYMNTSAFNPISGITEAEGPDGWLQTLISRTNPVLSLLAQISANERIGTEMPVTNRAAPTSEQAADMARFAGENLIPGYRFAQSVRSVATGKSPYPLRRTGEDGDTFTYNMEPRERVEKASQMARMAIKTVDLARAGRDARLGLMEQRKGIRSAISKALREAEARKGAPLTEDEQDAIAERYIKTFEAARQAKMGGD